MSFVGAARYVSLSLALALVLTLTGLAVQPARTPSSRSERAAAAPPYRHAGVPIEQRVSDLLGCMSLEEKIGQMMQVSLGRLARDPGLLTRYGLGSVLSGGDDKRPDGNSAAGRR